MNSIMVIRPYKYCGQWVFDDENTGLVREAFVAGIDKMMDALTSDIKNADEGFILLFSEFPFPGNTLKLEWKEEDLSGFGNWYYCEKYEMTGWLCPSLFKYFSEAPSLIYVKAQELK